MKKPWNFTSCRKRLFYPSASFTFNNQNSSRQASARELGALMVPSGCVAASAGICQHKKAGGSTDIRDDMQNAGARWVNEPTFSEGNLV